MDHNLASGVRVKDGGDIRDEPVDAPKLEMEMNPTSQEEDSLKHVRNYDAEFGDTTAEVNMDAAITIDDVIRAGGFGARDDISSFLPVAMDSTDFEASLRDARDFEEPQKEISRPGLGWAQSVNEE